MTVAADSAMAPYQVSTPGTPFLSQQLCRLYQPLLETIRLSPKEKLSGSRSHKVTIRTTRDLNVVVEPNGSHNYAWLSGIRFEF